MKKKKQFNTPILFIIFRRADTAVQVIDAIAKVKPKKLYISQDGPRNEKEKGEVLKTREAVLSRINWDCKLTKWFHKENLGLKKHIPQAFDKFFEREEFGIYLEDDTLPNEDFFYFMQELLRRYKDDERIFAINGTNLFSEFIENKYSYYLSQISCPWGMGIWKRSWELYDSNCNEYTYTRKQKKYKKHIFSDKYYFYIDSFIRAVDKKSLNTWDVQLNYLAAKNLQYFITPSKNLINNIGINHEGTNPFLSTYNKGTETIIPIRFSTVMNYDVSIDEKYFNHLLKGGWFRLWGIRIYLFSPHYLKKFIEIFTVNILKKML
jgi:hypothetical protein